MRQIYSEILGALEVIKNEIAFYVSGNYFAKDIMLNGGQFGSFSIIPRVYESELNKKYGIILGDLRNGEKSGFQGDLVNNIFFNEGYDQPSTKIEDKILKKYEDVPDFCSMSIDTEEKLLEHVKSIHESSYNHYVWAKETNLKGRFPSFCCGKSSRNLFLTLMDKGYPNSLFLYNDRCDHAYVALPFVFGNDNEKGFIVIDPTSDQLFNDKKNAPRNNLFVIFGTRWDYETDWEGGHNLYPSSDDNSTFANLHTLRTHPGSSIYEKKDIDEYFSKIFKNPVNVEIESI